MEIAPIEAKVVLVGDSRSGKSSVWNRIFSKGFKFEFDPTTGVEFASKIVVRGDQHVKLQIWDTAGQELFRSLNRNYYKKTILCLAMYSVDDSESFKNAEAWLKDVTDIASDTLIGRILVANKTDLDPSEDRITSRQGRALASRLNTAYLETSALTNTGIKELEDYLVDKIIEDDLRKRLAPKPKTIKKPEPIDDLEKQRNPEPKSPLFRPIVIGLGIAVLFAVSYLLFGHTSNNKNSL